MVKKLLIINLKAMYSSMFNRNKKKNKSMGLPVKIGIAVLAVYVVAAFATMVVSFAIQLRDPFYNLGIGWMYFTLNSIVVFSICVITCIFTAQAQIFNAKDNELLLSMPIKPSSILLSRVLTLLVTEYIFEALISIPMYVVWAMGGYATVTGTIFFVIEFLLLPLMALAVACLLAWILTLVTSRMRKQNFVTLVISVIFLVAYVWLFSNLQQYIMNLVTNGSAIADAFRQGFPPLYYFGSAISDGNALHLLIFIAFAIIPFAIMIGLLSHSFIRIATTKRGAKKRQYHVKALKSSGHIAAVNKLELRRYWNNTSIILNTSLGGMFALVIGGYLLFSRSSALELVAVLSALLPDGNVIAAIVAAAFALTAAMNVLSAALISLEGNRLWILRSMPISSRSVLLGKLATHLEISLIPAWIGGILSIFALFTKDLEGALMVLILPTVFIVFIGIFGLIINLHMPKLDWTNELQPVKHGMPVLIVMFGMFALLAGLVLLYVFALSSYMNISLFVWLVVAVLVVLDILLSYWLVTAGARKFEALEA